MARNPMDEKEHTFVKRAVRVVSRLQTPIYRLTRGRLARQMHGRDVCLVTMTGARSGKRRTLPVMYVPWDEGVLVVASLGGAPKHPIWFHNLIAHPDIEVQYLGTRMKLRARLLEGEERARAWPTCVEHYPLYERYQSRTDRVIPVFACEPHASSQNAQEQ